MNVCQNIATNGDGGLPCCVAGGILLFFSGLLFCFDLITLEYTAQLRDAIKQEYIMMARWLGVLLTLLGSCLASLGVPIDWSGSRKRATLGACIGGGGMLLGWLPAVCYTAALWSIPQCELVPGPAWNATDTPTGVGMCDVRMHVV